MCIKTGVFPCNVFIPTPSGMHELCFYVVLFFVLFFNQLPICTAFICDDGCGFVDIFCF